MKLKQVPEDFQVEELSDFQIDGGPHAVYRLEKNAIGTIEAIRHFLNASESGQSIATLAIA